jgi:GNAT superfamily N-acetyltransferase
MARPATLQDAIAAIEVVRQSITVSCLPDHRNDRATLDRWLGNKTPDSFVKWISNPENFCAVEEVGDRVQGVGLLHESGELRLFYVAPGHERTGLGRTIHALLLSRARVWGLSKVHLESTSVARPFYEALGLSAVWAPKAAVWCPSGISLSQGRRDLIFARAALCGGVATIMLCAATAAWQASRASPFSRRGVKS